MTSGYAVFNSLLGSTVDTHLCQAAEACGNSRISLREGGPRILRSIPSCAGGFLTDVTHFHCEGDTLLRSILDTRPMKVDRDPVGKLSRFCSIFRTPSGWT